MAHFAKVINGIVTEVNVVDWETLNQEGHPWGDPSLWIQTTPKVVSILKAVHCVKTTLASVTHTTQCVMLSFLPSHSQAGC